MRERETESKKTGKQREREEGIERDLVKLREIVNERN